MMKAFLATTAVVEVGAGIALMAIPDLAVSMLLGDTLGTAAAVVVARIAGAALLSLGVACWGASRDAKSKAAFGIASAMLIYNIAAVGLLLWARYGAGIPGVSVLLASALHAALALWCVTSLRSSLQMGLS